MFAWICTLIVIASLVNYFRPLPVLGMSKNTPLSQIDDATSMPWPTDSTAAVGAAGYGVLAASSESETPVPTASIAKIITALSVLKQKPLNLNQQGPVLTLTQADVDSYNRYYAVDGSIVKVAVGEKISEYQALQAMLLPSANNMADTLATWAFGSLPSYSAYANQFVKQLHMARTTIGTDASGLSPTTTSTPSDLILLGEVALQNPVIAQIVSQTNATVPVAGTIPNVNRLLGKDGINGIKTGNSNEARGCILYSATYNLGVGKQITIIGAVMGAPTVARAMTEVLPLLDAAKAQFSIDTVVHANQSYGDVYIPWLNSQAHAIAQYDTSAITWQHTISPLTINLSSIKSSASRDEQVGSITTQSGDDNAIVPLVLDQSIPRPTFWWRLVRW
ncbi:MAG: D-alanyl-D-alanine carboxypeptidase family protein [Candidatus Saccharibacteria bacterium]